MSRSEKAREMAKLLNSQVGLSHLNEVSDLSHLEKVTKDSLLSVVLPFGSDTGFKERYVNHWGQLRVGRLFEEIDVFAANIGFLHCDDGDLTTAPAMLVTASFDRLDLLKYPLRADEDILMTGAVTYSGRSSMNIDIDLSTMPRTDAEGKQIPGEPIIQASATFVARNSKNRAVPVPRLVPQSEREKQLYARGEKATQARKNAANLSLLKYPPSSEELAMVHDLFVISKERDFNPISSLPLTPTALSALSKSGVTQTDVGFPQRIVYPDETVITNYLITMPQHANVYGKVFGGFIMRQAYELAFSCAWRLTGRRPAFLALDDITFLAPVEVGTLLKLEAKCTHTPEFPRKTYMVSVTATMQTPGVNIENLNKKRPPSKNRTPQDTTTTADASASPERQEADSAPSSESSNPNLKPATAPVPAASGVYADSRLTNEFNFVFHCDRPELIPRVFPRTYDDAMEWINAHRRLTHGAKAAEERRASNGPVGRFNDL